MSYDVVLTDDFLESLKKIRDKSVSKQVLKKLVELETDPHRFKRLHYGLREYYRLRVGGLRVLYRVVGSRVYVEVLVKDHRYRRTVG